MAEVIDNAVSPGTKTLLQSGIGATDITIPVQDFASTTLQGGQFRVILIDPTTGNTELALITGGQNTLRWTLQRGVEGTTPRAFPAQAVVKHIITAQGLANYLTSLPTSVNTTATDPSGAGRTKVINAPGDLGLRDVVSVKDAPFDAVGDGVAVDHTAINTAITNKNASANGGKVVVPYGTYRCTSSIVHRSNVELHLMPGAIILKDYSVAVGATPLFTQPSPTTKISNASVTGTGKITAGNFTKAGQIFALFGDNLKFFDFTIDTWGGTDGVNTGGQAFIIYGNRIQMRNVKTINPYRNTSVGGIRFGGGNYFVAIGCYIESGDDALQFVPVPGTNANQNLDTSKCAYIGCTGWSSCGRFLIAGLVKQGFTNGMSDSIRDCEFIGCHGGGCAHRLMVQNTSSSGEIRNVNFTDCTVDSFPQWGTLDVGAAITATTLTVDEAPLPAATYPVPATPFTIWLGLAGGAIGPLTVTNRVATATPNQYTYTLSAALVSAIPAGAAVVSADQVITQTGAGEIDIDSNNTIGGSISKIRFTNVRVLRPHYYGFYIAFPAGGSSVSYTDISWEGGEIQLPNLDPTYAQMFVTATKIFKVRGCKFDLQPNAGSDVVMFGSGTNAADVVTNGLIEGCYFPSIGGSSATHAIDLQMATNTIVARNVFGYGGGNAVPLRIGSTTTLTTVRENDFSAFAPLAAAPHIIATGGQAPIYRDNIGFNYYPTWFGDGADGVVTLDGIVTPTWATLAGSTYTLTRSPFLFGLTVNVGITLIFSGSAVFVSGTFTNNGILQNNGNAGSATGTAGTAGTQGAVGSGQAGGAGNAAAGSVGTAGTVGSGGSGGAGGTGALGAGGSAVIGSANVLNSRFKSAGAASSGAFAWGGSTRAMVGGSGGGGGGGDGTNKGGGGGAGGGVILIWAVFFINTGSISATGGAGGTPTVGNAGGGGGGGGGLVLVYSMYPATMGTVSVAGGAAGSGFGTGAAGSAGSVGLSANYIIT